jgi:hypothetical protein
VTVRKRTDAEAKAMFELDNEIRRVEDPDFKGSVWDKEWENVQPVCQNLYLHPEGHAYYDTEWIEAWG